MDNYSDRIELLLVLKKFAISLVVEAMFDDWVIKTTSSNAESCEEQDGGKHSFVEWKMAELQAIFQTICCEKHGKEVKTKDFNLAEEGSSTCKLHWLGPSEQEFYGE